MDTADLDYPLPPEAIAQTPVEPRDSARLLIDGGPDREPGPGRDTDLPSLIGPGDLVVVNTTRVLTRRPRLRQPPGGHVEALRPKTGGAAGVGRTLVSNRRPGWHG